MPAESDRRSTASSSGLDHLERPRPNARPRSRCRAWSSLWPKLAADRRGAPRLADRLSGSSGSRRSCCRRPSTAFGELWDAAGHVRAVARRRLHDAAGRGRLRRVARDRRRDRSSRSRRSAVLRTAIGSLITGLQTMPSIAWFPLAILLFKISEQAILFVVVLGAAPSIANGIIAGVDSVPPILRRRRHHDGRQHAGDVPRLRDPGRDADRPHRAQAGLGVQLAQPDGGRAARDHPRHRSRSAPACSSRGSSPTPRA